MVAGGRKFLWAVEHCDVAQRLPVGSTLMCMKTSFIAAFALAALVSGTAVGQDLLVLSKKDHTLALVDPYTLIIRSKVPVGNDPHEVIAADNGRTAWVTNYGSGAFHTLAVIDLLHSKALPAIELGALSGPHGLAFADGKAWFTAEGSKVFGRLDPTTHKVDLVVGTGQDRTHMIYVSPNGSHVITTNVSSGTVSLLDAKPVKLQGAPGSGEPAGTHIDWEQTVIKVGPGAEGFDVSPDGHEVWVANAGDGTVSIIDWLQKKVVATIQANAKGGNRLKFTADGKIALITAGGEVVVLDTATRSVVKRVTVGKGPTGGILMQPGVPRAFIACSGDNYVAVLDLKTWKVTEHLDVGGEPDGMAWAPKPR
jgi:YVTN family beta-propeller protein